MPGIYDLVVCIDIMYADRDMVMSAGPVKRETGERPVRTRHCNCGAFYHLWRRGGMCCTALCVTAACSCAGRTLLLLLFGH